MRSLGSALGNDDHVDWADRAFVRLASRLIHPSSEHGLAGKLEMHCLCNRAGAWMYKELSEVERGFRCLERRAGDAASLSRGGMARTRSCPRGSPSGCRCADRYSS